KDADTQLEVALSGGVNFVDTAEMYAVPPSAETYGATEQIIGNWLAANPTRRKDIVLASKISGPGLPYIRDGNEITPQGVKQAVEDSLKRLQTDYIDLYQLHWPNRTSPHFGRHWPGSVEFLETDTTAQSQTMLEILGALNDCIEAGKIRYCGLSNETPWGLSEYLRLSEKHNLPRVVSVQNEFSLLHSKDSPYLLEHCIREDVSYLPWSPLAGGMLSGKYLNGERPAGSRWTLLQRNGLFRDTVQSQKAVAQYVELATDIGITPSQLALSWCKQVEGVTSVIIGATSVAQLEENLKAFSVELSQKTLKQIEQLMRHHPLPF
ncbi:aldo/keto reductase, partial [Lacimicrobium alkaliphilum]